MSLFKELSNKRCIFHSEDDFKFALAWQIKSNYPNVEIRLEQPFELTNIDRISVDLVLKYKNKIIGLELKYITRKCNIKMPNNEIFLLKSHGATGQRRYDIYRDIKRLETLKSKKKIDYGFVVLLTNEASYNKTTHGVASKFIFNDNHTIKNGTYNWCNSKSWLGKNGKIDLTKKLSSIGGKKRKNAIKISGNHKCHWKPYYIDKSAKIEFNYLSIAI